MKSSCHRLATVLATFGAIAAVVCFLWGSLLPGDVQPYHTMFLRTSVLGWTGMDPWSFLLMVVQWTAWGALIGWVLSGLDSLYGGKK